MRHRFDFIVLTVCFLAIAAIAPYGLKEDNERIREQKALAAEQKAILNVPIVNLEDLLPPQGTVVQIQNAAAPRVQSLVCFKTTKSRTVPRVTILAASKWNIAVGDHVIWRNGRVVGVVPLCAQRTS